MKRKKSKMNIAIVEGIPEGIGYPFKNGDHVLFLGEIKNMPDHYVIVDVDGKIHWGYHDYFRILSEEET